MKNYIVSITTEERYHVTTTSEAEALEKLDGLEPSQTEVVDTSVDEDT